MVGSNVGTETAEVWKDEDLSDVIRIDDMERKRAYFFWPDSLVTVGREINGEMTIIQVPAKDVLTTDLVVIGDKDKPDWTYDMAIKTGW